MKTTTDLLPVAFHGDKLFIVEHGGEPYVPMRPIVEGMGLAWKPQFLKLMEDQERFSVAHMVTQMPGDDQRREVVCLPLRRLFGWLMTVSPNKVKPALRERIIRYQRECDEILWRHWTRRLRAAKADLGALLDLTRARLGQSVAALNAAMVLQWLMAEGGGGVSIEISLRQLAREARVSRTGVVRSLTALAQWGLARWEKDGRGLPGRVRLLDGKLDQVLGRPRRQGALH